MDLALKNYQEALSINPNYPEAHNNLANMYSLQKNFPEAIQEFQAALALRPDYFEAQFGLAGLYLIQGHTQQALEEYRKAHRLKPDIVESHLGKALVMKSDYPLKEEIRRILALLKQETPRPIRGNENLQMSKSFRVVAGCHRESSVRTLECRYALRASGLIFAY